MACGYGSINSLKAIYAIHFVFYWNGFFYDLIQGKWICKNQKFGLFTSLSICTAAELLLQCTIYMTWYDVWTACNDK